jgi:hypothetical protein
MTEINQKSDLQEAIELASTQQDIGYWIETDLTANNLSFQTKEASLRELTAIEIEKVLDRYQFNDSVKQTELGTEMSLVIPQGSSFEELFNEINATYNTYASSEQKQLIANAIYQGNLFEQAGVSDKVGAEEGLEISGIPMVKGSTGKTLSSQMDRETGRLKDVEQELYGMSKLEIAAIAALKLLKSVSEKVLVTPYEAKGDALEGKASRALGGGYVDLSYDGIFANVWPDDSIPPNIGCAGSGRSPSELKI